MTVERFAQVEASFNCSSDAVMRKHVLCLTMSKQSHNMN